VEDLALKLFPYPHVLRGERKQGTIMDWPDRCSSCDRQCEGAVMGELALCSYGLNYQRVDEDLLVAGLVVNDFPTETKARAKMRRKHHEDAISGEELERVIAHCREGASEVQAELEARLDAVVSEYRETKTYQNEILDLLRPELEQTLAQVHDYKQFVQQIVQNMVVLLESKFPEIPLEEKLEKASHEEAAIYWAAVVMDEKLDAALFLESPQRIYEKREQGRCRLHGLVLKYVRIYQSRADRKGLRVAVVGDSWGEIEGNTRALGIIPHTLIDNAIKYAPDGSRVQISFEESRSQITLSVSSYGPRIEADERGRIFDLFYRGSAARQRYKEGTGFGLASAQNIAKAHDSQIVVAQDETPNAGGDYLTHFSVCLKRAGAGQSVSRA
jgi:signal transduction histidine kinase